MAKPDTAPQTPRRDFLRLAWNTLLALGGALTFGGLARFFSYQPDPPPPVEYDLGPARDYLSGTSTIVPHIPAVVKFDGKNYSAFSLKCTHLGCTVEKVGDSYECPCHGSRFDDLGELVRGPAARRLPELRVEKTEEGNLRVFAG